MKGPLVSAHGPYDLRFKQRWEDIVNELKGSVWVGGDVELM